MKKLLTILFILASLSGYSQTWTNIGTPANQRLISGSDTTYRSSQGSNGYIYFKSLWAMNSYLALKAPIASPTFTGTVTMPTPFTLGAVSVLPTGTELNYVDGVTSNIQTQLDSKIGLSALSATSPIFYDSGTGVISSQAASASLSGYVTAGTQSFGGDKDINGLLTATTARIGVAGTGSMSPMEIVAADGGLAITSTANTTSIPGTESYVAYFLKDAAGTYRKWGAHAVLAADNNTTNGFGSWNVHTTSFASGVTSDNYNMTVWAKHGVAFHTPNILAATAPGLDVVAFHGDNNDTDIGQIIIKGQTNTAKRLSIGFNTTSDYGFISSYQAGVGIKDLKLQPNGGEVIVGGNLSASGSGTFGLSSNTLYTFGAFRNTNNGTSAASRISIGNDASVNAFTIDVHGSNFTAKNNYVDILNQFNAPLRFGANGNVVQTINGDGTTSFVGDVSVPDEVYGAGWNGSLEVPTKNAMYDKIESIGSGTVNTVAKFTGTNAIGNSLITDNGSAVGINTTTYNQILNIKGATTSTSLINLATSDASKTLNFGVLSDVGYVMMENNFGLNFGTSGVERLNISNAGILTVTSTPTTSAGTYDILTRNTSTGVIEKIASTAAGDVTGPASATDNAIARYDLTTGKLIQSSGITISDALVISTVTAGDDVEIESKTNASGGGGDVGIYAGIGTTSGGTLILEGGGATGTGNGGDIDISGGSATEGNGGSVSLNTADGVGTDRSGGNVNLYLGTPTGSGTRGKLIVTQNISGSVITSLDFSNQTGTTNNIKFPDASGTLLINSNLFDNYATVGNVTTSETDLSTYTTAAGRLANNGEKIEASYAGNLASLTANTQLKVYFGGTAIFDSGATFFGAAEGWSVNVLIIRVSSSVIRYSIRANGSGNDFFDNNTAIGELTGLTLSGTNILKITGTSSGVGAATDDIQLYLGTGEWKPAAQ